MARRQWGQARARPDASMPLAHAGQMDGCLPSIHPCLAGPAPLHRRHYARAHTHVFSRREIRGVASIGKGRHRIWGIKLTGLCEEGPARPGKAADGRPFRSSRSQAPGPGATMSSFGLAPSLSHGTSAEPGVMDSCSHTHTWGTVEGRRASGTKGMNFPCHKFQDMEVVSQVSASFVPDDTHDG